MKVLSNLKNILINFTKSKLFVDLIDYILVALCLVCSGYAIFTTEDTTGRTIFTLITTLFILIRYILNFDVGFLKKVKTNKKLLIPLPTIICFLLIGVAACASLFLNGEGKYFISYFYFGILIISSVLLCRVISFDRFRVIFCNILFVLSIIAIILFGIFKITTAAIGFPFDLKNDDLSFNTFYIFTQSVFYDRIQSIFWEPGVYASYLLFALSFELLFNKNAKISHIVVFIVALILTFSTAAYLIAALIFFPAIIKKIKNKVARSILEYALYPVILISILLVFVFANDLAKILPDVFGKIAKQTGSFTTRLYSPKINFEIFLEKPLFGWGIHGSNARYLEIAASSEYASMIDAQTSTSVGLLARFGVLGGVFTIMAIAGILGYYKKTHYLSIVSFLLLFLVIVNKEPHGNMLISWAIPFYFVYESFDKPLLEKRLAYSDVGKKPAPAKPVLSLITQDNHSGVVARNVLLSFGLKGVAIVIGLFTIPVYSSYFNNDSVYGIWLTFLSIITWVMTFDLGFGNGMKLKLIQSIARNDDKEGKRIVSSTYGISLIIGAIILGVGILVINLLDLTSLFNFDPATISSTTVRIAFCITFATIAIEFVLKNICHIFRAYQRHFLSNLLPLIANVTLLIFAATIRIGDATNRLLFISIAYCVITLMPYILASIIAFAGPMKSIAPNRKYFSMSENKRIVSIGLKIFIIQIALLFLNSADQMIISSIFSSESVVIYTKYYKFFNVLVSIANIFNGIILTSICKSIADNSIPQLKKGIKSLILFDIFMCILCGLIAVFMQPLVDVWLGSNTFDVNPIIVLIILIFTIENIFVTGTSAVLNGFECLIPQVITFAVAAALKIPLILLIHHLNPSIQWEVVFVVDCFIWIPILTTNIVYLIKSYRSEVRRVKQNAK